MKKHRSPFPVSPEPESPPAKRATTSIKIARVSGHGKKNTPKKPSSRTMFLWLLVLIPVILLAGAAGVYSHFQNSYHKDTYVRQSFVDSWNQLTDPNAFPATDASGLAISPDPDSPPLPTPTDIPAEPPKLSDVDIRNDPIIRKERIDDDVENLLIIGIDGGDIDNEGHRSDTMLVISIDHKTQKVKLVSIMRDIWTYFPNRNTWNKINASYAFGGPGQTVNIINESFDLDIQQYIVMDFSGYQDLIDLLGGVSLRISEQEASVIPGLSGAGTYTLSGEQTLVYSRIRKIDSDFIRVQRQRNVLMALLKSIRGKNPATQYDLAVDALKYMRSNIPAKEITGRFLKLAVQIDESMDQMTVPEAGMYTVHNEGTWYMSLKWDRQIDALHEFLYGSGS
ncbi:MAG: LCP family protein [Clostridiales bacterium]|nr:LCP family protein [Clostridiales bacterium]